MFCRVLTFFSSDHWEYEYGVVRVLHPTMEYGRRPTLIMIAITIKELENLSVHVLAQARYHRG